MHNSHKKNTLLLFVVCALSALSVSAKVTPEQAAQLGLENTVLTPMGSERAGNADGSIPAWTGGITEPPAGYTPGDWYVDPFADDEILFTITAQNYKQYADKLTPGTQGLFVRYPDTFVMHIYPSRRSASYPDFFYENSIWNATNTEFISNDKPTNRTRKTSTE